MLWLWHRPAATAPIQALAWEPPCVTGEALKRPKKKKKKKNEIMPFATTQMDLEIKTNMISLICGI